MRCGSVVGLFGVLASLVAPAAHRPDRQQGPPTPDESAIPARFDVPGSVRAAQASQSFGTTTTAITVDVVVQDKRHNPITDLRRADFELTEDGVRQDVAELQVIAASATANGTNATARAPGAAANSDTVSSSGVPSPTFVALVFDELTTEGRNYANKAVQAYLETQHTNDFAGVFQTGSSLVTVTPYTNDVRALAAALRKVAGRATTPLFDPSKATGPGEATAPAGGAPPSSSTSFIPSAASGASLAEKALGLWEMERLDRGYATADGLRAIVGSLGFLPGRKTVVFFAENLSMPDEAMRSFTEMTAAANRANVAIYTVDVAGLRGVSPNVASANAVNSVGQAALEVNERGESRNSIRAMESMERTLRENPHVSLTHLSRDTGGFLIDNTNDLTGGFRRIDADRRFHYVLTYTPRNADFNGEWRGITVKIPSRPGVIVRARSGYVAVHTPGAIPLLTYEGRAVADLSRQPSPTDLPIRAAALVFPRANGGARIAIVADTMASALTFEEVGDQYRSNFTVLAQLRDEHGEVVRKASRPFRLAGPIADRAKVQAGSVLFYRQPTVPPGQYTLEVVVDDALARRAGVLRIPVTVRDEPQGPRVSSLMLVARAEKLSQTALVAQDDNELTVGNVQLYPNIGQPYRSADNLSFYAAIIPGDSSVAAGTLSLARGDTTLASQPLVLPAADASGRIRVMGELPLASLGPGSYTLTLTITGGPAPVIRGATFSVLQ